MRSFGVCNRCLWPSPFRIAVNEVTFPRRLETSGGLESLEERFFVLIFGCDRVAAIRTSEPTLCTMK